MKPASLDELISKKAEEFADQVRAAAAIADKEEEIRIEVEKQLAFVQREAGVKLTGKHEFTVASGRVDSVYNCVIIEYKNPSSPAARIGPGPNAPGAKKVVEQIKSRFYDMRSKETLNTLFGVGCDGNHFIFVRYYNDKWQVQEPVEVNKHSAERFLWALFNLGSKGKRFEPDYLAGDFGSAAGSVASAGIKVLYDAICGTDNPKALTFFNQWKILFGEVCGYDVDNPSEKIKKLGDFYGVPGKGVKPAELLFSVHTYYALFMKLLAGEIIGHFHKLPSLIGKMIAASSAAALKWQLGELEAGGIFRHLGITNFLEGDLFAWYLPAWSDQIEDLIRKMTARLDQYNPGTLAEEPAESRDMLKKLYQQLFPKSVRHDLGEYYTPDWLAEHVLNEVGYVGDPDKRLLDPACGSGTFLVMAITRIRSWYEKNREKLRYDEGELCQKILANVVGFDLNPLAVMAARTNYLIAIRDLVSHVDKVEIPVYLCDSITTPYTAHGVLFDGVEDTVKKVPSVVGPFEVPVEVLTDRAILGKYSEILESSVREHVSEDSFVKRCEAEAIPFAEREAHIRLVRKLIELDRENRNGVWARIIKNSFAPVFVGRTIDYVVGNPPWVNYENLPAEYREASEGVWDKYDLFPQGGWRARFAKGNTELAMVFVYASMDYYLRMGGSLGFVITQSVFQSKASGRGFRAFCINRDKPIRVKQVTDLTSFQPFDGAVNRTAVFTADLSALTEYPVPYEVWRKENNFDSGATLEEMSAAIVREDRFAAPVGDRTSPWMVVPTKESFGAMGKLSKGLSGYRAWKGADTRGGNGIFWLQPLQVQREIVLARNTPEYSKKKPPQREWGFEPDLIYPLLRGRETRRWHAAPSLCLLFPHRGDKAIPGPELESHYPKTWGYLKSFEAELKKRKMYDLSRKQLPFWSLFETGPFLLAPYKVVWKYVASELTCAVVASHEVKGLTNRIVIPDHKLVIVPFKKKAEAHYVCGLLNSSVARFLAKTYVVGTQISTHILEFIKVRPFAADKDAHSKISELSVACHKLATNDDEDKIKECESNIDALAARIWGLTRSELASLQRVSAGLLAKNDETDEN